MSLIMAMPTKQGIIVSGDYRRESKYTDRDSNEVMYTTHSDFEQKVFRTNNGHAIALAGNAKLNDGTSTNDTVYKLVKSINRRKLTIKQEIEFVKKDISAKTGDNPVALLIAGYENGKQVILKTDTRENSIQDVSNEDIAVIGVMGVAERLIRIVPPRDTLCEIDVVEYIKFLNRTVAKMLEFSDYNPMVSEDCDVLVITEDNARWKTSLRRLDSLR
jgi:hypothetical protein